MIALIYDAIDHSIFTKRDREDPVPTQFKRALLQLDIEPIQAQPAGFSAWGRLKDRIDCA